MSIVPPDVAGAGQTYPNGQLAWIHLADGSVTPTIWATPYAGTTATPLTNGMQTDQHPDWSPDGRLLAFSSHRVGVGSLWVMDADGTGPELITDEVPGSRHPDWSPDGSKIAFEGGGPISDVYVVDVATGEVVNLTNRSDKDDGEPSWSPDGTKIAYTSQNTGANTDIKVMNADGTGGVTVAGLGGPEARPDWSPDGTQIAFHRFGANGEVWIMDADGDNQVALTDDPGHDIAPTWSPDGTAIAFTSPRDGQSDIWLMDADGSNEQNLTNLGSGGAYSPDWGPVCREDFTDTPLWVAVAVDWVFCENHMTGYDDNTFRPNLDITRGQLARVLYRAAGSPDVSGLPPAEWSDIPNWIDDAARWLDDQNYMTGYPDGTFRPNLPITRGQVTRALYRAAGSPAPLPSHGFTDVPNWLTLAVSWAALDPDARGPLYPPMTGYPDDTFRPDLDITRAQTTRVICRANAPTAPCYIT